MIEKFKSVMRVVLLLLPFYLAFGVFYPTKMVLINDIVVTCVNITCLFISNTMIELALLVRSLFL